MKESLFSRSLRKSQASVTQNLFLLIALLTGLIACTAMWSQQTASPQTTLPEKLSAAEFARLSRDFSEEGGYFLSDNFTSNETGYLHILDKLKTHGTTGGAYIGVGPEQNFTYIAKLRPRIVFLLDIRRQAIIQHLMYKAIFHQSPTRAEFLSRLLARPLPKEKAPAASAPIKEWLDYFSKTATSESQAAANLSEFKKLIQEEFLFPLTEVDKSSLDYVYKNFAKEGLNISFRLDDNYWGGYFPTLREIIEQTDLKGNAGNFLASVEDYEFVRELHRKNLIIPVVGNFAGPKAIAAIGEYLRKHNVTVNAFYTSNVEQYLFDGSSFDSFASNLKKLPINDKSLLIRAVFRMRYTHPAQLPDHLSVTLLQPMKSFVKEFEAGKYLTYRLLLSAEHLTPERP